jgi:hypothetical protein
MKGISLLNVILFQFVSWVCASESTIAYDPYLPDSLHGHSISFTGAPHKYSLIPVRSSNSLEFAQLELYSSFKRYVFENYLRAIFPLIVENHNYTQMFVDLERVRRSAKWQFGPLGLDAVGTSAVLHW